MYTVIGCNNEGLHVSNCYVFTRGSVTLSDMFRIYSIDYNIIAALMNNST